MSLVSVALVRLFAGRGIPRRSMQNRLLLFVVLMIAVAYLVYRTTPSLQPLPAVQAMCLTVLVVYATVTAVFLCTAGVQRTTLQKLTVFWYMPLPHATVRRLVLLAFAPFALISAAVAAPMAYSLFHLSLTPLRDMVVVVAAYVSVLTFHIAIRTTSLITRHAARAVSIGLFFGALLAGWEVLLSPPSVFMGCATVCVMVVCTICSVVLRTPAHMGIAPRAVYIRHQWQSLGIVSGLLVRASRTPRYQGVNLFLTVFVAGMSLFVWLRPAVPFDAVCVMTLLLAGTLAQEVRSLYKSINPLEAILYGLLHRWTFAMGLIAYINAAFFTAIILAIAILWFPHDVGAGYMQVVCIGIVLVAAGSTAGAIIVPRQDDVLLQLLSTALYAVFGWLVLRGIGLLPPLWQPAVACASILVGYCISYGYESARWAMVTRGKYVFWR